MKVLYVLGILLLAACTRSVDEKTGAAAIDLTAVEPTAVPPIPAVEEELIDNSEETDSPIGAYTIEIDLFTEDDRPERLKLLTSAWNTDWTRHTMPYTDILSGGPPRDGIQSIDKPAFVSVDEASEWLADNEPIIYVEIDGDARAYPLQILIWHEIVNDTFGSGDDAVPLLITFCPLCNSAIVFDRRVGDEVYEFGTSGLLRYSDLIMYDRTTESLWQQFTGTAIVGQEAGLQLDMISSSLIGFGDFKEARPQGMVLSKDTGFPRTYGRNPYVGYDEIGQNPFLFQGEPDGRLPAIARVITLHMDDVETDIAYPLADLERLGVIHDDPAGIEVVLFHQAGASSALNAEIIADGVDVGGTAVYTPILNGKKLTFISDNGIITDEQTDSVWNILGEAVEGELKGESLEPINHADHFWFSWAAFRPDTIIWEAE